MQILNIFHVLIAISLVAFVLIQKGQGATAGAAFGAGASGTVFGARGAGNFLSRTTWVLAALFCAISLTMAVIVSRSSSAPENDLGVLGSSQPAPVVDSQPLPLEPEVGTDDTTQSDLPVMDDGAVDAINTDSSDDLPVLQDALQDSSEPVPDVQGQEGEENPDSGGS